MSAGARASKMIQVRAGVLVEQGDHTLTLTFNLIAPRPRRGSRPTMKKRCSLSRLSKSSSSLVVSSLAPSSSKTRAWPLFFFFFPHANWNAVGATGRGSKRLIQRRPQHDPQSARPALLCPLPPPAVLPLAADPQGLCVGLEPRRRVHGPELEVSAGRHQGCQGRPRVGEFALISLFRSLGARVREFLLWGWMDARVWDWLRGLGRGRVGKELASVIGNW